MQLIQIGTIRSPYKDKRHAPKQGRDREDILEIEVFSQYSEGLKDIKTVSHLIVLYWLDRAERDLLVVNTPWDTEPHGVFATRSPARPNPIAFNVADLLEVNGRILVVKGLDALDGSPLIDIKPYISKTDAVVNARIGWFEKAVMEKQDHIKIPEGKND